jgi:hypothetical protein
MIRLPIMSDTSFNQASPFVCDLNAIDPAHREQHSQAATEVFHSVQAVRELPNGYAFRLPNETGLLLKAIEFIAYERLCCPFFGFTLQIEPEGGAVWLHLTGREGVKPFIRSEIAGNPDEAARMNFPSTG